MTIAGVIAGVIAHDMIWGELVPASLDDSIEGAVKSYATEQVRGFKLCSDIFLSLVKVIVAPLVFSLLLVGLVKTGNFKAMGRIGLKTMTESPAGLMRELRCDNAFMPIFRLDSMTRLYICSLLL